MQRSVTKLSEGPAGSNEVCERVDDIIVCIATRGKRSTSRRSTRHHFGTGTSLHLRLAPDHARLKFAFELHMYAFAQQQANGAEDGRIKTCTM